MIKLMRLHFCKLAGLYSHLEKKKKKTWLFIEDNEDDQPKQENLVTL